MVDDTVGDHGWGGLRIRDSGGQGVMSSIRGSSVDGEEDQVSMCRDARSGLSAASTSPVCPGAGCIMVRVCWVEGQIHLV